MNNAATHTNILPGEPHARVDNSGIMKDFARLLHEIVPLLENVKNSIEESSSRIPKASMQLSKVTQATESAAVEILNVLESMTAKISSVEDQLQKLKSVIQNSKDSAKKISDQLCSTSSGNGAFAYVEMLTLIVNEYVAGIDNEHAILAMEKLLDETKKDSMNIAMALQVQDITSQQIAGVAHIIESVQTQLANALDRFENGEALEVAKENVEQYQSAAPTFDIDAHFTKSVERQDLADEIVKQFANGK